MQQAVDIRSHGGRSCRALRCPSCCLAWYARHRAGKGFFPPPMPAIRVWPWATCGSAAWTWRPIPRCCFRTVRRLTLNQASEVLAERLSAGCRFRHRLATLAGRLDDLATARGGIPRFAARAAGAAQGRVWTGRGAAPTGCFGAWKRNSSPWAAVWLAEAESPRSSPRAMDSASRWKTLRAGSRLFTRLRSSSAMADSRGDPERVRRYISPAPESLLRAPCRYRLRRRHQAWRKRSEPG